MDYPSESFSFDERARLAPHFTNLDSPVFGLVNLPETVKGALFARYSRYQGTLRRLFLDEFVESMPLPGEIPPFESDEGGRAAELYERIFLGYGDDSVAQLGGMHVAVEWCSNVLTKVLQRPRIGAYLEQSTRYIAYDAPMSEGGGYRYYRDPELGEGYSAAMDEIFSIYSQTLPHVRAWVDQSFPGDPSPARDRAIQAKALDLLRGILPAASLSHMGIYASGQTYEQLILHLLAHPLPEARATGQGILDAVQAVMPSFVTRVERPERGGVWVDYLRDRDAAGARWAERLGIDPGSRDAAGDDRPSVRLLHVDGDERQLLASLLFEATGVSETATLERLDQLDTTERAQMLAEFVGNRENRRHRPGRGFESLRYRFEIVSDYGAFRDLQRHRMLTVQWQQLTPHLGVGVPAELDEAGYGDSARRAYELSEQTWQQLVDAGQPRAAAYALCLGFRIRYILDLNAREAMQLIELRSGREGHPSYRAVAHQMHAEIERVHPTVAAAMTHVDRDSEPRLERILSEMRTQAKLDALTT